MNIQVSFWRIHSCTIYRTCHLWQGTKNYQQWHWLKKMSWFMSKWTKQKMLQKTGILSGSANKVVDSEMPISAGPDILLLTNSSYICFNHKMISSTGTRVCFHNWKVFKVRRKLNLYARGEWEFKLLLLSFLTKNSNLKLSSCSESNRNFTKYTTEWNRPHANSSDGHLYH